MRWSFSVDHGLGHLRGTLYLSRVPFIQDVDVALGVNKDLGHPAILDVHSDDQRVIVKEEDCVGIYVREGDRPTRGRGGPVRTI